MYSLGLDPDLAQWLQFRWVYGVICGVPWGRGEGGKGGGFCGFRVQAAFRGLGLGATRVVGVGIQGSCWHCAAGKQLGYVSPQGELCSMMHPYPLCRSYRHPYFVLSP